MPEISKGEAILRVALVGADGGDGTNPSDAGNLTIGVNGNSIGTIHPTPPNNQEPDYLTVP